MTLPNTRDLGMRHRGCDMQDESAQAQPRPSRWLTIFRSRDFLRDIVVTTLGVLLALFIGEIAENVRWSFRLVRTEASLHDEASRNLGVMIERGLTTPCIERRLSELTEILDEAGRSGRLPSIANIGRPVPRPIFRSAWDIAQNEGAFLRLKRDKAADFRTLYDVYQAYRSNQDAEGIAWANLELLAGSTRPYALGQSARIAQALAESRYHGRMSTAYVRDARRVADQIGLALRRPSGRALDVDLARRTTAFRPICKPLIVDGQPYRLSGQPIDFTAELPGPIIDPAISRR